jgi:hypothetical protein
MDSCLMTEGWLIKSGKKGFMPPFAPCLWF